MTKFPHVSKSKMWSLGLLLNTALASHGMAQQADTNGQMASLEEVVVTATKRGGMAIQDVPFAVQSLDGQELSSRGAVDFNDYFRLVPGLAVFDQGPGDKRIILRGVNSVGAGTVGLYLDEVIITGENAQDGGGRQPDIKLFDIERVEVLKGPQGTTFGSSSMSGTIRYITRKPDSGEINGYASADLRQTENASLGWSAEAAINVPIVEGKAAVRVAGTYFSNKGYIDNQVIDGANSEETGAVRALLRLTPTDDLTIDLTAMYQDLETDGPSFFNREDLFGNPLSTDSDNLESADVTEAPFSDEIQAYNATIEYRMDHGSVTGTASFFSRDTVFNRDSSGALAAFIGADPLTNGRSVITQPKDRELQTYELRYASNWDWPVQMLAGVFYQAEDRFFRSAILSASNGVIDDNPMVFLDRTVSTSIDEFAFFGEVSVDITDRFTITGGIRYFDFSIDEQAVAVRAFGGGPGAGPGPELSASEDGVIFRGNLSYRLTDENQLYFNVAEGFRSGGTNDQTAAAIADVTIPAQFNSDSLVSYELGSKNSFMDGRLTINLAGFFIDWSNIQLQDQATDGQLTFPFRGNGGGADILGAEVEALIKPINGLDLGLSVAYTNAELGEDNPVPSTGLDGDELPYVPEWTFSLTGDYYWTAPQWGVNFNVGGDLSYIDSRNTELRPTNPFFLALDDYALLNLRAGVEWDSWRVNFIVNNVTDNNTVIDVFRIVPGVTPDGFIQNRPRTFILGLRKSF